MLKNHIFKIVDKKYLNKVVNRVTIADKEIKFLATTKEQAIRKKDNCLQENSHLYKYFGTTDAP